MANVCEIAFNQQQFVDEQRMDIMDVTWIMYAHTG